MRLRSLPQALMPIKKHPFMYFNNCPHSESSIQDINSIDYEIDEV